MFLWEVFSGKVGIFCCLIFLLEEEGLYPAPALVNRWVLSVITAAPGSAMGYAIKWSHVSSSWEVFVDEVQVVGMPPQLSTVKAKRPFQLRGWDCNVLECSEFSLIAAGCSPAGILEALSRGRNESRTQYCSAYPLFPVVQKHPSIVH